MEVEGIMDGRSRFREGFIDTAEVEAAMLDSDLIVERVEYKFNEDNTIEQIKSQRCKAPK